MVETDGCHSPVGQTSSELLPFSNRSLAIEDEGVELAQDAVCSHLSVESVGVVEVLQQLLLLDAGQRRDLLRVPHLWGGRDRGII